MTQLSMFDPIEVLLTKGYAAKIDPIDSDLASFKWIATRRGYAARGHKGRLQYMHRIILGRAIGHKLQPGEYCDHINGNALDNRRCNLRVATTSQNMMNKRKLKPGRSAFKGVTWHKQNRGWAARITCDGKQRTIGVYETPEQAARAYDAAAIEYFGEFARTNAMLGLLPAQPVAPADA